MLEYSCDFCGKKADRLFDVDLEDRSYDACEECYNVIKNYVENKLTSEAKEYYEKRRKLREKICK